MSFPYKNPISPSQLSGQQSLERTKTYGTSYSTLSTGGYMEVYSLDQLYYTIPPSTYGPIEYSGNSIPITFSKGSGTTFSFDTLTLQPDNISSGRRKLGMLVYVYEENQIYQFLIDNYDTLWNAATGSTGTTIINDFGTTIKANSAQNISFINSWTANTIDGVSGQTYSTAVWKKYTPFSGNTSATCITDLYVDNLYGCSPINVNDLLIGNSGITTTSLTANTISATTYLNIPIKYYKEFSGTPTTTPIVLGTDSISIGNGAESRSTFMLSFGTNAGKNATSTTVSTFIGGGAGYEASGSTYVNFIGANAGYGALSANSSTFLNSASGNFSTGATYSNFFGTSAGESSKDLNYSNVLGYQAGLGVTNAQHVNYFGRQAGWYATNATLSNFIGFVAGTSATNAQNSNFIGTNAGTTATNASYSNFIGSNAGNSASNASYSNLIGFNAGKFFTSNNIGSNNIIIGTNISLPSGATNSINIGGVLFGTGTYSNTGTDPSIVPSNGKIGINVVNPSTTLHVGGDLTISGSNGNIITNGSSSTVFLTFSGSNTIGGTGYTDFIRVTNTAVGATTPSKTFRVSNLGGFEIINNGYTSQILSITDNGILSVAGGNAATTTSNDGTSNYLTFNNNSFQLYDDGNPHIHSRSNGASMWINTNNGQLNLLTQSPTSTGSIGSGIAIATTTLNGYVTINTGRTITTAAAYGFLTTGGAGTYPGGSQSVTISLYANNRIWGQEIDAFSDERMKDIQGEVSLEEGLKLINNLKPIKYTWKEGDDKGVKVGYSAQQVIKSGFDHLVSLIPKEGLDEKIDDDGFLSPKDTQFSMNYDQVTPYHGVVIKHLLDEIENLKKEIEILKNK